MVENLAEFYFEAKLQRCVVHFYRTAVRSGQVTDSTAMLKAIHSQEEAQAVHEKAHHIGSQAERDAAGATCRDRRSGHRGNKDVLCGAGRTLALPSRQ
jgi:putative transposase